MDSRVRAIFVAICGVDGDLVTPVVTELPVGVAYTATATPPRKSSRTASVLGAVWAAARTRAPPPSDAT
jgi:hypothetical protein